MGQLYKVLDTNGEPCHGGIGRWALPQDGMPGEWMPDIHGRLILCRNGYHLCRLSDLVYWLGPTIYLAEADGEIVEDDDKIVVRRARLLSRVDAWDARTTRLFAADCAEHVLSVYEERYLGDSRPRDAIAVARRYATGQATDDELAVATRAVRAAYDAADAAADAATADDAAYAAAYAGYAVVADAAHIAYIAYAARAAKAARAAARVASAAGGGAYTAAAEREWQTRRLAQYLTFTAERPTDSPAPQH